MGSVVRVAVVLALTCGPAAVGVQAQGENHWYNQYGDHSFLLGGAVIGGASDLGAVFYNPGRVAQIRNAGFFLQTNGFQRTSITVENGGGPGRDATETDFGGTPGFAAGAFRLPVDGDHWLAYSYLTRRVRDLTLNLATETAVDSLPGTGTFVGSVDLRYDVKEDWFGLTWSNTLNSSVSIGVTAFGTHYSREHGVHIDARADTGATAAWLRTRQYDLSVWGLLLKAGLAVTRGPFEFGVSVTTPQAQLFGGGSTRFDDLLVGVDTTSDGIPDDQFVADRQEDLSASWKTPGAIGVGASWRRESVAIHLSAEWYSGVSRYTSLEPGVIEDFSGVPVGEYRVVSELDPVLNFGAGLEWSLNDALTFYGSVTRDESPAPPVGEVPSTEEVSTNFLVGDITHFGGGLSARTQWFAVSAGLTYSSTDEILVRPLRVRPGSATLPVTSRTLRFQLGLAIQVNGEGDSP